MDGIVVLERGLPEFGEPNFCGVFCNPIKKDDPY